MNHLQKVLLVGLLSSITISNGLSETKKATSHTAKSTHSQKATTTHTHSNKQKQVIPGKTKQTHSKGLLPGKHHKRRRHYYDTGVIVTSGSENRTDTLKSPEKEAACLAQAKEYAAKAKQARSAGKQKLAKAYDQCASANKQLATGYRLGDRTLIDLGTKKLQAAQATVSELGK